MSNSIDELKSLMASKQGLARPNVFRVIMPSIGNMPSREVNLLCKNINLPGKQILTQDRVIGTKRQKIANGYAVDDLNMTFLVLNDYGIKNYFETWAEAAFSNSTYEVNYKQEYQRDIIIQQLKKGVGLPVYSTSLNLPRLPSEIANRLPTIGPFNLATGQLDLDFIQPSDVIYQVRLENAFPTTINAIELNNELDGVVELNIQMSYTNWKSDNTNNQVTDPSSSLGNLIVGSILNRLTN